jgi:hypothetical protein
VRRLAALGLVRAAPDAGAVTGLPALARFAYAEPTIAAPTGAEGGR